MSLHTVGHVGDTQQKPGGEILRFVLFEGFLEGFSQLYSMGFYLKVMVMSECNTTKFKLYNKSACAQVATHTTKTTTTITTPDHNTTEHRTENRDNKVTTG